MGYVKRRHVHINNALSHRLQACDAEVTTGVPDMEIPLVISLLHNYVQRRLAVADNIESVAVWKHASRAKDLQAPTKTDLHCELHAELLAFA